MKRLTVWFVAGLLIAALFAFLAGSAEAGTGPPTDSVDCKTKTPVATMTPRGTHTPRPSRTPRPTHTPKVTATSEPEDTATPDPTTTVQIAPTQAPSATPSPTPQPMRYRLYLACVIHGELNGPWVPLP